MAESSEGDAGKVPNLGERQLEHFYAFCSDKSFSQDAVLSIIPLYETAVCERPILSIPVYSALVCRSENCLKTKLIKSYNRVKATIQLECFISVVGTLVFFMT